MRRSFLSDSGYRFNHFNVTNGKYQEIPYQVHAVHIQSDHNIPFSEDFVLDEKVEHIHMLS